MHALDVNCRQLSWRDKTGAKKRDCVHVYACSMLFVCVVCVWGYCPNKVVICSENGMDGKLLGNLLSASPHQGHPTPFLFPSRTLSCILCLAPVQALFTLQSPPGWGGWFSLKKSCPPEVDLSSKSGLEVDSVVGTDAYLPFCATRVLEVPGNPTNWAQTKQTKSPRSERELVGAIRLFL